jgi:hypothetical protein
VTVTVWVAFFVLPAASVATHVIVVVPSGNRAPIAAPSLRVPIRLEIEQLSVAVVPSVTVAPHTFAFVVTLRFAVVIEGGVLSTMVTVWVAEAVLPDASVAVYVSVVVPTGKR